MGIYCLEDYFSSNFLKDFCVVSIGPLWRHARKYDSGDEKRETYFYDRHRGDHLSCESVK